MNRIDIYVDGSFTTAKPGVTYGGFVMLLNDKPIHCQQLIIKDPSMTTMRNVGGELFAAFTATMLAANILDGIDQDPYSIYIYHDYEGIAKFAALAGGWKAKKPGAMKYQQMMFMLRKKYPRANLHFVKVAAHTGVLWNEVVDKVANGMIPSEVKDVYKPSMEIANI